MFWLNYLLETMELSEAIKLRIKDILKEKNWTLSKLCAESLITPSTLYDFIYGKSHCPSLMTIYRICNGAGIKLDDFFKEPYFDDISNI